MLTLKLAQREDADQAMQLIEQAKAHLKAQGMDQWQNGYPDLECIQSDLKNEKGYFLVENQGDIVGYLCIDFDGEPAYDGLRGEWKGKQAYAVVHRMAVSNTCRGKGFADRAFQLVLELCEQRNIHSIRVDTDADNAKMQHILNKNGFSYCGKIWFDNSEKIAFEKLF